MVRYGMVHVLLIIFFPYFIHIARYTLNHRLQKHNFVSTTRYMHLLTMTKLVIWCHNWVLLALIFLRMLIFGLGPYLIRYELAPGLREGTLLAIRWTQLKHSCLIYSTPRLLVYFSQIINFFGIDKLLQYDRLATFLYLSCNKSHTDIFISWVSYLYLVKFLVYFGPFKWPTNWIYCIQIIPQDFGTWC